MLIIKNHMFKTKDKDDQRTTSCHNYQLHFLPIRNLPKAVFDELSFLVLLESVET